MGTVALLGALGALLAPLAAPSAAPMAAPAPATTPRDTGGVRGNVGPHSGTRWPTPIATRTFLKIRLKYSRGNLHQLKLLPISYPKIPRRSRIVGRFLAEAYQGKRLLDVVPFNFPLLAPAESFTPTGAAIAARLEENLVTMSELEVPWLPTVDRILIKDVATGRAWPLDLASARARGADPGEAQAPRTRPRPTPSSPPRSRPRPRPRPRGSQATAPAPAPAGGARPAPQSAPRPAPGRPAG